MRWRPGADLGANSLGWAVIGLNADDVPIRIVTAGSRIFSDGRDPKSGAQFGLPRHEWPKLFRDHRPGEAAPIAIERIANPPGHRLPSILSRSLQHQLGRSPNGSKDSTISTG